MGNSLENLGKDLGNMVGQVLQRMTYLKGVNLIYGRYNENKLMRGADENMNVMTLSHPELVFDQRDMGNCPIHLYFVIAGDEIKMNYEFRVQSRLGKGTPMLLSDLTLDMHIKSASGKSTTERLNYNIIPFFRPQVVSGSRSWKAIDEFLAVKSAIERGDVYITWNGKVQWVDISSENPENVKKPDYRPNTQIAKADGKLEVVCYSDMFAELRGLLCWEERSIDGHDKLYYMDPFMDNALYFLPQEFRIRALPNNAPDMTTELVSKNNGQDYDVLMRFGISPYVHPNAKRDLYGIYSKRKKKEYCEIRYGGYSSAFFDRSNSELADRTLYGKEGFELLTEDKEIKATPESCFCVVLKAPRDGLVKRLQEDLMDDDNEGIHMGDVYFNVYEGLDKKARKLGPIPVMLNLHKLAGISPRVSVTECKWPDYTAKITNTGRYPIQIGGAALSVLRTDGLKVKDVKHELKSDIVWPQILDKGGSVDVKLSSEQVEKIKHRRFPLFWKIKEDYWTEYICEPYHIRLPNECLKEIMETTNESAADEYEKWKLSVKLLFEWDDYPDVVAVQVEIKNEYGLDEVVTLTRGEKKCDVSMTPNLNAVLKTLRGDRNCEYRVRAITKTGPKNPAWGEWTPEWTGQLLVYGEYLTPAEVAEN